MRRITVFLAICFAFVEQSIAEMQNEWSSHGYDRAESRYVPHTIINSENAHKLGFAWEFRDFIVRGRTNRGNEATPLMVDGVLYFSGPWSVVYAVDARTGKQLWVYDPDVPGQWARKACCDMVNRGVAIVKGRLYIGTTHGYLDAVDLKTGKRVWRTDTLIDRQKSYTITGAPRIADDKIIIGNGGAELGVRGYVSAYDRVTGELVWRFYTVPGEPGTPDEHPEITDARKTWSTDTKWQFGLGGTVWDSMVYDPDLNWVYIGVGNGSPWPAWSRSPVGENEERLDNLFLSSILALDANTGRLQWHYQTTPGDSWDYTATQHMILANISIKGKSRKVIMQAPKNGFFYVMDRLTGELLSAKPYTKVTWAEYIDTDTGRPVLTGSADYSQQAKVVSPSMAGGHNWQPMAYNIDTGLAYIPTLEMPVEFTMSERDVPLTDSINADVRINENPKVPPSEMLQLSNARHRAFSVLKALNPAENKLVWQSLPQPWWAGGVLTTAGNIVVQGGMDGALSIYDAKTGKVLQRIQTGTPIMAAPISYILDGEQYIAVLAGFGGSLKAYPAGSAPLHYENFERLLVFKLDGGETPVPPEKRSEPLNVPHQQSQFDLKRVVKGQELFLSHCARCHSYRGVPNGYPNLWNLPPDLYDQFDAIILDGAYEYAGMPRFDDLLDKNDVSFIREFLLQDEAKFRYLTQ